MPPPARARSRRVERPQVVEPFADADELHRQAELVRDRDGDAALRRAVELRQRDAGHADGVVEEPRLLQPVLAGRRVDDEQHLVRRALAPPGDHAPHLRELVHQVRLRVQPAGRVDDHDVRVGADRVVGDRGRDRRRARRRRTPRPRAPPRSRAAPRPRRGTCRRRRASPCAPTRAASTRACRSSSSCRCR